jgi:hypothetical protein
MSRAWSERMGRHALATENAKRRKRAETEAGPGEQVATRERRHGLAIQRMNYWEAGKGEK